MGSAFFWRGDRSFRVRVVSLTFRNDSASRNDSVYTSFSQPRNKKVRYTCTHLVHSATDQVKAVRELT